MRSLRGAFVWLAVGSLSLAWPGCTYEELPSDEVCRDVGYSIANRVMVCTGDRDLTSHRYDVFQSGYACRVFPANRNRIEEYYACPVEARKVACEVVIAAGDDLDAWLSPLPYCADILEHADGTPLEGAPDAGAPDAGAMEAGVDDAGGDGGGDP